MEWLTENWILVLVIGGMAAMHLFGHRHGGGRGHGGHKHTPRDEGEDNHAETEDSSTKTSGPAKDA